MGFGSLEWFYGRGYELIGVALAYGCGLIDLVVGCCGLSLCGGWFFYFFHFFMLLFVVVVDLDGGWW